MNETELRDEATGLLRDLIRIDSSNPPGRETPAALLLQGYLQAAGVECELVTRDPERANLVARIRGSGEGPVAGPARSHRCRAGGRAGLGAPALLRARG